MLIEFTVGNFRSFKEKATLSMVAAKIKARDENINKNNTIVINDKMTLLTSAGIYGANASGKSNLIKALGFMRLFVTKYSTKSQSNEEIQVTPFRLCTETETKPSFFEVVFLLDNMVYRYGFEADSKQIVSEWLFYTPRKSEVRLFAREGNDIQIGRDFKGGGVAKKATRSNALFLSTAAQLNCETAVQILGWFSKVNVITGILDISYRGFTDRKFTEDPIYHDEIVKLIHRADVDIEDLTSEARPFSEVVSEFFPDMPQDLQQFILQDKNPDEQMVFKLISSHTKRDANGMPVSSEKFDLENDESAGTQKLYGISGPIIDTLLCGEILIIDEIEARLHTLLTRRLIQLFNSKITNPKNAQLIFATHDTNLLSNKLFRRDQIWFVEKDEFSASHLYSLAEIKVDDNNSVRNDALFEDDYLHGRYGAIPLLGDLREMVNPSKEC